MVDTSSINNFVTHERAKDLCLNYVVSDTLLKTVNTLPTTVHGFAPKVPIDLGRWMGGAQSYCGPTSLERHANCQPTLGDYLETLGEQLIPLTSSQNETQGLIQRMSLNGAVQTQLGCPMRPLKLDP
ncbi:hypothetical protein H5410_005223 [Solanum commersonii]|uniref:Uncharacterized protein n=1 Tax=Solanum commersonii TaxID=4109 RepID=A0A9J6A623_SOLCO|nr:hypothetical protein H5410_005223 [Solanum commersonii]